MFGRTMIVKVTGSNTVTAPFFIFFLIHLIFYICFRVEFKLKAHYFRFLKPTVYVQDLTNQNLMYLPCEVFQQENAEIPCFFPVYLRPNKKKCVFSITLESGVGRDSFFFFFFTFFYVEYIFYVELIIIIKYIWTLHIHKILLSLFGYP